MNDTIKYVLFWGILSVVFLNAESNIIWYKKAFHGSLLNPARGIVDTDTVITPTLPKKYPARGLMMSLIIPGTGQLYAGSIWKSLLFFTTEITSWVLWRQYSQKGEDERIKFENFADDHWHLYDWWLQTPALTPQYGDVIINGTHRLLLLLKDGSLVSSDTLTSGWIDGAVVIRDDEFYENIGKYDQFVAGWDDLYDDSGNSAWWEKKKKIGNKVEILVMTDRKNSYLNKRARHNDLLKLAKYSVTAVMFNHLISAIDAVWETHKQSVGHRTIETSASLFFSPYNSSGVGGIQISIRW